LLSSFHKPKAKYRAFKSYWRAYGGFTTLIESPWFGFAVIATAVFAPLWLERDSGSFPWLSIVFSTIPALLGFSIGSISILIGFSSGPKRALHKLRGEASYYLKLIASFFHFILMQFLCFALGLGLLTYPNFILSGLTFFVFSYALFSGVAAAAYVYSMAEIYDKAERLDLDDDD